MKNTIILFLVLISANVFSQQKFVLEKPKVDNRIELLSIVFRLAESPEYSSTKFKLYTDSIEKHFSPYKKHALITFIKKIRKENGVSYDAVMKMAVHIDQAPNFTPLVTFSDSVPEERWGKENALKFIELLRKFYVDANCKSFFKKNENLYLESSARFIKVYDQLDVDWYTKFYGKDPKEKFIIINGLGNGGGNYGPDIQFANGERSVYAIMGTWSVDSSGLPNYEVRRYFPTLLHEFNHSFVNSLTEKYKNDFRNSGEKIFPVVEEDMNNQAYGDWETMISEALVRAAVIKYMKDHNFEKPEIDIEVNDQLNRGFLWINELVTELENYDKQRAKYPTLESYMPEIVSAYTNYANNIVRYETQLTEKRPKVVSITEFKNNDNNVNPEIKVITINFDKELLGKGYSINYGDKGENNFPEFGKITYSTDNKSVIMEVKLQKGKEYQFVLSGSSFKSKDKIPMKDYEINFKTKK